MSRKLNLVIPLLLSGSAIAQSQGMFTVTGSMTIPRTEHAATLLMDGRVLLTGDYGSVGEGLASAEIYDPSTGTFTATGRMVTRRRIHSSTLLPDGRVLIAGGYSVGIPLANAEIFDPASGAFTPSGNLVSPRGGHTAILLASGKVLILGGDGVPGFPLVAPAEIYDPDRGSSTPAAPYSGSEGCDFCAPSTLLADGRILFPGQNPAQLYDPATGIFTRTGSMLEPGLSAATLLMNGTVLFAGGEDLGRLSRAELYNVTTGAFSPTGDMLSRRVGHTLTLLPDGQVLAAGGETDSCVSNICSFAGSVATAELYDPISRAFSATGSMTVARETHTATLLNDGRVLLTGGVGYGGIGIFYGPSVSAELYTPPMLVPAPRLFSMSGDGKASQGAIWNTTTGDVASTSSPAAAGDVLSMYTTSLVDGSVIPPQVSIGGRLTQILFFGNAPGYPGYYQVNFRVPRGVAGPDVSVRLMYLGRSSNEVTMAVR